MTLTKEDGTGRSDANSYASVADSDAYHEGHLYAGPWNAASPDSKAAALVMATRLIDACVQFNGTRSTAEQALAWPRRDCPDPEGAESTGGLVASTLLPPAVVEATCETARALVIEDRTANPQGEGLKFVSLGDLQQSFDKADRRPIIPHLAQLMLARYGRPERESTRTVDLVRV